MTARKLEPLLSPADGFLSRLRKILSRWPLHVILIVTALLWMTPSIGLLISSFRPATDVASSGWWTAFQTPFEFTLDNYSDVLSVFGMGQSVLFRLFLYFPG
jgi:alpha-glucoside transport system permease protein